MRTESHLAFETFARDRVYDEAGNWLNPTADSKWVYNLDNEITGRLPLSASNATNITVTGEVEPGPNSNKWYQSAARLRETTVAVSTNDGTFSIPDVAVYPGQNTLKVTVTDVSGNTATQTRTVIRTNGALEYFSHDASGNLTNWVSGSQNWTYEWDWADRLTKVSSNGVVLLQNWYDAHSRRIAKFEVVGGQTKRWLYLYDGWDIVGMMDESGVLQETFTRGVGLAGDIGTLVAVTHHTGANAGTHYTHHNHRGDIVLVRSGTTTAATYDYSAFGTLTTTTGTDLCRFKFSSKEREATCGLSYYGHRFYAPQWQRWINRDPIGERGGGNLYRYVFNRPAVLIDANGLKDRSGGWDEGGLENDCSTPVWVIDLDNNRVMLIQPGTEAPEGVDWDFVLLPGGVWHKIGLGELDICDKGPKACQWGYGWFGRYGGHRPATPAEIKAIEDAWENVPILYVPPEGH